VNFKDDEMTIGVEKLRSSMIWAAIATYLGLYPVAFIPACALLISGGLESPTVNSLVHFQDESGSKKIILKIT
jgi:hypothetical protein